MGPGFAGGNTATRTYGRDDKLPTQAAEISDGAGATAAAGWS